MQLSKPLVFALELLQRENARIEQELRQRQQNFMALVSEDTGIPIEYLSVNAATHEITDRRMQATDDDDLKGIEAELEISPENTDESNDPVPLARANAHRRGKRSTS